MKRRNRKTATAKKSKLKTLKFIKPTTKEEMIHLKGGHPIPPRSVFGPYEVGV